MMYKYIQYTVLSYVILCFMHVNAAMKYACGYIGEYT